MRGYNYKIIITGSVQLIIGILFIVGSFDKRAVLQKGLFRSPSAPKYQLTIVGHICFLLMGIFAVLYAIKDLATVFFR